MTLASFLVVALIIVAAWTVMSMIDRLYARKMRTLYSNKHQRVDTAHVWCRSVPFHWLGLLFPWKRRTELDSLSLRIRRIEAELHALRKVLSETLDNADRHSTKTAAPFPEYGELTKTTIEDFLRGI